MTNRVKSIYRDKNDTYYGFIKRVPTRRPASIKRAVFPMLFSLVVIGVACTYWGDATQALTSYWKEGTQSVNRYFDQKDQEIANGLIQNPLRAIQLKETWAEQFYFANSRTSNGDQSSAESILELASIENYNKASVDIEGYGVVGNHIMALARAYDQEERTVRFGDILNQLIFDAQNKVPEANVYFSHKTSENQVQGELDRLINAVEGQRGTVIQKQSLKFVEDVSRSR